MTERLSSYLILLGGLVFVLALWYLSILAVRIDTRKKGMKELQRKAWIGAAVVLPLFGFALYLFMRVLRRYLTPAPETEDAGEHITQVRARAADTRLETLGEELSPGQYPMPEPAWGAGIPKSGLNGKGTNGFHPEKTPSTIPAAYLPLRARYALVAVQGPHLGEQFPLQAFPVRIGRGPEAGIQLDSDLNVSRRHAEVYEWNGRLHIRDLGSTHGTLINGIPVMDQALSPGDRIALGGTVFILRELP